MIIGSSSSEPTSCWPPSFTRQTLEEDLVIKRAAFFLSPSLSDIVGYNQRGNVALESFPSDFGARLKELA